MSSSNTHRSSAIAKVLIAYSAGETGGIVGANTNLKAENIYFNDTPLRSGGSFNFEGVTFNERYGTPNQSAIKGFANSTSVVNVGTQLRKTAAITRVVSSADVDSVRVVISFPQLAKFDKKGTDTLAVELKFEVKDPSGAWQDRGNKVFEGKTFTTLEVDYEIDGPTTITGPWQVRITRITDDSFNKKRANDTYVQRIVEVRESRSTYPDTALVSFRFDLEQFGGNIPTISMKVQGIKVRVPNNYYETRAQAIAEGGPDTGNANHYPLYVGNWDGGFKWAVTSNPAWVFYHLAYNTEYGAGIDRNYVSKSALYSIGQYCDAVSSTMSSGQYRFAGVNYQDPDDNYATKKRRRYTFNNVLNSPEDALTVLQNIASSFRGLAYYGAGLLTAVQDCPRDLTQAKIVTNEHVGGTNDSDRGVFHYRSTDMKYRTSVARVTYNDKNDHYRQAFVQYPEEEDILTDPGVKRYGRNLYECTKYGCDNAAEAYAYAKYLVYSAQNETRTVTFTAGPEHGHKLRPGMVFKVMDRRFTKERFGGRILPGSTSTRVNLDVYDQDGNLVRPVFLTSGVNYQISIVGTDGETIVTRNITSGSGSRTFVNCASLGITPTPGHGWIISGGDIQPQLFRVAKWSKKSALEYEIEGAQHDAQKFAAVEQGKTPKPIPYMRDEYVTVNAPTNIVFVKRGENDSVLGRRNDLHVGWTASTSRNVKTYTYQWRKRGESWSTPTETKLTSFVIKDISAGFYDVRIVAENVQGRKSLTAEAAYEFVYASGTGFTIYPPAFKDPL